VDELARRSGIVCVEVVHDPASEQGERRKGCRDHCAFPECVSRSARLSSLPEAFLGSVLAKATEVGHL
jgi:hypothetical protein